MLPLDPVPLRCRCFCRSIEHSGKTIHAGSCASSKHVPTATPACRRDNVSSARGSACSAIFKSLVCSDSLLDLCATNRVVSPRELRRTERIGLVAISFLPCSSCRNMPQLVLLLTELSKVQLSLVSVEGSWKLFHCRRKASLTSLSLTGRECKASVPCGNAENI